MKELIMPVLIVSAVVFFILIVIKIKGFQMHDIKHIWSLFYSGVKSLLRLDWNGVVDSYYWIIIHFSYNSKLVDKNKEGE